MNAGRQLAFADSGAKADAYTWLRALRVHQWVKNGLIFAPLFAAHRAGSWAGLADGTLAFAAFSCCASALYLFNDILDVNDDRLHARKRFRPLASGRLSRSQAVLAALSLLSAAAILTMLLPPPFAGVLAAYVSLSAFYSLHLKKLAVVDVIVLALLYATRLIAGAAADDIVPSFWLLAFATFFFLSLAILKRYAELRTKTAGAMLNGRGYVSDDLPVVLSLGTASGLISVLILAMYTQAPIVPQSYRAGEWLWLAPVLILYWITRIWVLAQRGSVDDDPVVFASRDRPSLVVLALLGGVYVLASVGWRV